jgi:hypothetical protein
MKPAIVVFCTLACSLALHVPQQESLCALLGVLAILALRQCFVH